MNREQLIERLTSIDTALIEPITGDEAHRTEDSATPAAVLVGVVPRESGPQVILTQRTDHLKDHAGQISFPGGRVEDADRDSAHTALREAQEEIGLEPHRAEVLGRLPSYRTITGFRVDPVVAWIADPNPYVPDPFEVADVFEVPLAFILDTGNHQRASRMRNGERRHFYVLPYEQRYIWGATAGMLVNFARLLNHHSI
jgi:8-oxo-dGTP pyrophosphatase MutT (NUDIX family)